MGQEKETHMIDFSKTLPRTEVEYETRLQHEMYLNKESSLECGKNISDSLDLARQYIAARPTAVIAIAFAIGGALGWLTSRR